MKIKPGELLDNELMRVILSARIDSLWRMIGLMREGRLPEPDAEGATGALDNKGALFVPGGLVFDDSDRKPIRPDKTGRLSAKAFRNRMREAMQHDNASLLYRDGLAIGVNLDNGFFADIAGNILASKQAAHKRRPPFEARPAERIDSAMVTRSHCPTYVPQPYGSRTRLSSCVAICQIEPRMYYVACRKEFGLRGRAEEQSVWENIRDARKPLVGKGDKPLAPACVVVCHTTRYHDRNLVGLTRLLGYGHFGQFATLTMEKASSGLLSEAEVSAKELPARFRVAAVDGFEVVAVLRLYPRTRLGRRHKKTTTRLIAPREDMDVDPVAIGARARERYGVSAAQDRKAS